MSSRKVGGKSSLPAHNRKTAEDILSTFNDMATTSWFITGYALCTLLACHAPETRIRASRGLGLEFVRQLTDNPRNIVVASCRSPETASALQALREEHKGRLYVISLDVSKEESIVNAAAEATSLLGESGLDILFNNAAVVSHSFLFFSKVRSRSFAKNPGNDFAYDFNTEAFLRTMQCNVVGPALMSQHFLPLLKNGKRKIIINMTSGLASVTKDLGPKCCVYSMSKAALNMLVSSCRNLHSGRLKISFRRLTSRRRQTPTSFHSLSIPGGIRPVRIRYTPRQGMHCSS